MYLIDKVKVKINSSNFKHYSKYYSNLKCNESIVVNIDELTNFSSAIIKIKCDSCGIEKELTYKNYKSYGYSNGSYHCKKCKSKINNIEKYGVENVFQIEEIKNKIKKTNIERYRVENISQSKEIQSKKIENYLEKYGVAHHSKTESNKKKIKETCLEKYGVENVSKLEDIKNTKIKTCLENNGVEYIFKDKEYKNNLEKYNLEKYGVCHYFEADEFKKKARITNLERYGVENPTKNENIKSKIKNGILNSLHKKILSNNKNIVNINSDDRTFDIYCEECKSNFTIGYFLFYKRRENNTCICTNCNKIDMHQSGLEVLLKNFINNNYDGEVINGYRLEKKEIDIYLPKLKLGFEFNGVYWHSEIYKVRNYHKEKTEFFKKNGIQLIHIWEDDWLYKQDIVKSMILNKINKSNTKIYARKCEIREIIDPKIIKEFLKKNHIQGYTTSSIKIGLYYDNTLVSLMCFKKCKDDSYELNRFCSLLNSIVIGGASKLLNYFVGKYTKNIYTFTDISNSNGIFYEKLNFEKLYLIKPDYKYVVSGIRMHKFNYRNKDASKFPKIYDSGKIKYKLKII